MPDASAPRSDSTGTNTAGPDVSVVISTFNRASDLAATLPTVLQQDLDPSRYEVVLVNNNSADGTADVVRRLQSRYGHLRYEEERRPGASHGRNRGILASRAPIIAITDDDTEVPADWLSRILQSLESHPDAAFVGGPVMPLWTVPPPDWLTREHWGPLAIVEYGDRPLVLGKDRPLCLLTANFGVRRSALDRVGLFAPEFRRCQDHELQFRMWNAGLTGLYDPSLVASTAVPEERLQKSYHRMWYRRNGMYHALMPMSALFDRPVDAGDIVSLWGVPTFVYRELAGAWVRAATARARGREAVALVHETRFWYFVGYLETRFKTARSTPARQLLTDLWRCGRRLVRKGTNKRERRRCEPDPDREISSSLASRPWDSSLQDSWQRK